MGKLDGKVAIITGAARGRAALVRAVVLPKSSCSSAQVPWKVSGC